MPEINISETRGKKNLTERLKDSLLVIVALVFIILYAAAFAGKLDPLKDNTMLLRLEPVIFILIGYYVGRYPSRRCEQTLKEEITRQTQRADAAQSAKEKLLEERERLEEKIKNARTVIHSVALTETDESRNVRTEAIKVAVGILDS